MCINEESTPFPGGSAVALLVYNHFEFLFGWEYFKFDELQFPFCCL